MKKSNRRGGKEKASELFQEFKPGDKVAPMAIPRQFAGKTGIIVAKVGKAFIVKFLNGKTYKKLILKPNYIRKLK